MIEMRKSGEKAQLGLGMKCAIIFCMIFICMIILMTAILYRFFFERAKETVKESIQNTVYTKTESLRGMITQIDTMSSLLCDDSSPYFIESSMPDIYLMLKNYEEGNRLDRTVLEYQQMEESMRNYFSFLETHSANYSAVLFIDSSWNFSHHLRPRDSSETLFFAKGLFSDLQISQENWYRIASESGGEAYWFSDETAAGRLNMSKQINCKILKDNKIEKYVIGILFLSFDMSWLESSFDQNEVSYVVIRDSQNNILYSNNAVSDVLNLTENYPDNATSEIVYQDEKWYVTDIAVSDKLNAVMLVSENLEMFAMKDFSFIWMLGIIIILIGSFFVVLFSYIITQPIKALTHHMSKGELVVFNDIGNDRKDEIGTLYRAYNFLVIRIQHLMQNITEAAEMEKRAELRALQAQINPHFVYNTLDTVCCLLMLDGKEEITDILVSLSQIMRYNTKKPQELVPLSREIEILQRYYLIQQACYEDSLLLECDVEESAMEILVPKQILQPLVENAIFHSIGITSDKRIITVRGKVFGERLIIDIQDNGKNADIDTINSLIRDSTPTECSENIGVKNVNERLQYIYGIQSGLTFLCDENGYTVARILIENSKRTES